MQNKASTCLTQRIECALNGLLLHLKAVRIFPWALQFITLFFFGWLILALCQTDFTDFSMQNSGMRLFWHLWWPSIPFLLFFSGRLWCTICPFASVAAFMSRIVPRTLLSNARLVKHGAVIGFVTFCAMMVMDIVFGISNSARMTAWMLIGLLSLLIVFSSLFDRHTYCYTVCPFGFLSRMYARFALLRMKREKTVCLKCPKNDGINVSPHCAEQQLDSDTWKNDVECLKRCDSGSIRLTPANPWAFRLPQRTIGAIEALLPASMLLMLAIHIFSAGNYFKYGYSLFSSIFSMNIALFTLFIVASIILLHFAIGLTVVHSVSRLFHRPKTAFFYSFVGFTPLLVFFHMALVAQDFGGGNFSANAQMNALSYLLSMVLLACGFLITNMYYYSFSRSQAVKPSFHSPILSTVFFAFMSVYLVITLITIKYQQYFGC